MGGTLMRFDPSTATLDEAPAARRGFDSSTAKLDEKTSTFDPSTATLVEEPREPATPIAPRFDVQAASQQVRNLSSEAARTEASGTGTGTEKTQAPGLGDAAKAFARGATSEGLYAGAEGLSRLGAQGSGNKYVRGALDWYADAVQGTRRSVRDALPLAPEVERHLGTQIISGLGQAAGTLPLYAVPALGASMSVGQIYSQGFDDAKAKQADDATAHAAGLANVPAAALDVAMDRLIIGKILKPLRGKMTVRQVAQAVATAGAGEGTTEGAQQVWSNYVARSLAGYDPDRALDDQVINSLIVGTVVGGGVTGVGTGAAAALASRAPKTDAEYSAAAAAAKQPLVLPTTPPAAPAPALPQSPAMPAPDAVALPPGLPPAASSISPPADGPTAGAPLPAESAPKPAAAGVATPIVDKTLYERLHELPSDWMDLPQVGGLPARARVSNNKIWVEVSKREGAFERRGIAYLHVAPDGTLTPNHGGDSELAPNAVQALQRLIDAMQGPRPDAPAPVDLPPVPTAVAGTVAPGANQAPAGSGDTALRSGGAANVPGTAAKGKRRRLGPRADGATDIIDLIESSAEGLVPARPQGAKGGEWDDYVGVFTTPQGRLLVDGKKSRGIDKYVQALVGDTEYAHLAGDVRGFYAEVRRAMDARNRDNARITAEQTANTFMTAALEGGRKGRSPREPRPGEPVLSDELKVGDELRIKGQDFEAIRVNEDGSVVIKDGPRVPPLTIPAGAPIYADRDSVQIKAPASDDMDWPEPDAPAVPLSPTQGATVAPDAALSAGPGGSTPPPASTAPAAGQLFNDEALGFNLANEEQRAPAAPTAPAAATQEMFAPSEVQSTAPTEMDRRNAAARASAGAEDLEMGDPMPERMVAEMPPVPPGTPAGALNDGRMPVAMERIVPGTVDVPTVLDALRNVALAAGSRTDIREGRFYQQARGIAKSWEEVIRLRELGNLPTAAHEVGHIVSKAIFGSMGSRALQKVTFPKAVNRELVALGRALYGSRKPVAGYTAEGFSELVRLWLSTEDAAKKAPLATKWLEESLFPLQSGKGPFPSLGAAMRDARDKFDIWRGQGAEGRAMAQTKEEPGRLARAIAWARKALSKRATMEEFAPLEELAKAYTATTGQRLAPGDNPYMIATALRGTAGARLETWVEHGMTDLVGNITGPSLKEAVAPVRARDAERFELYLTALQAIERHKQGRNPGLEAPDVVYLRDKYAREHPEFITAAEKVADWWDGVLQYYGEAFPEVNRPVVFAIRAANPRYYGPLARVLDPERVRAASAASQGGGIHRFKGSGLPIKRLTLQSLLVAEGMIANAHRAAIARSVFALAQTESMGWILEEVPRTRALEQVSIEKLRSKLESMGVDTSAIPPDTLLEYATLSDQPTGIDPIIPLRTAAGTKWYQVPAQVFEILQGVQEPARLGPVFELFAGMPNRAFKLGTTGLRPSFSLVTNPVRDLQAFMLQSIAGNPATRATSYLQGLGEIVRSGLSGQLAPSWALAHQLGLQSSSFLGGDIAQARRAARGMYHGRFYRQIMNPVETLREILSFTESAPRLAEMSLVLKELGWQPGQPLTRDQAVASMVAFKQVTTDFGAKGNDWRMFFRSVPFASATTQGLRAFARAFGSDKGTKEKSYAALRVLLNGLALLTLPAIYNWWRNKDEDWWRQLPWRERFLYLNVASGRNVYQIPYSPEWGAMLAVLPVAALDAWYTQDREGVTKAMAHLFDVTNPVDLPVLAKTAKEQWQNRLEFFDRPIVPRGEVDLMPGMQRSQYSSELAKLLGDLYPGKVSPRRVDAAVRQIFGGVGGDVMDAPGALLRALDLPVQEKARESEAADVPIFGRLARRGGKYSAISQPLVDFWDTYNRYNAWTESNAKAQRDRRPALAPMSFEHRAYAAKISSLQPWIKLRLELAERTPEVEKRQAIYRETSNRAARMLAQRPKD